MRITFYEENYLFCQFSSHLKIDVSRSNLSLQRGGEIKVWRAVSIVRLEEKQFLTSVSERMAKILAIIVEKPGLRQLSAIKPNFNSRTSHFTLTRDATRSLSVSYRQYTQLRQYYYSRRVCSSNASDRIEHL